MEPPARFLSLRALRSAIPGQSNLPNRTAVRREGAAAAKEQSHMSTQSFADLGVSSAVARALEARGIDRPFPIQRLVVPDVLAGRDVLAKSPTGSGKTLAFGLPIADRIEASSPRPSALVLVPTRELASQIVDALRDV